MAARWAAAEPRGDEKTMGIIGRKGGKTQSCEFGIRKVDIYTLVDTEKSNVLVT